MTGPRAPLQEDRASERPDARGLLGLAEGLAMIAWAVVIVLLIGLVLNSLVPAVAVMTVDLFWGRP